MNMSLRRQLTLCFTALIGALFLINYFVTSFFLESYYYMRKQQVLVDAYNMLNENITDEGGLEEEPMRELTTVCVTNGISLVVVDHNNKILLRTMWTGSDLINLMLARLNGYQIGVDEGNVLEHNDSYTIQRKEDSEVGLEYLEMWGSLNKDFYFMMRFNVEGVTENVRVCSEFIKYICLAGIVLAVVIVWLISRRVTKPLHELTELSKRMAELDFDAKYTSGGSNEIGQLGEHFNRMSENLEKAYSELLTANNELQQDIQKKQKIDDMRKEFLSNVSHELKTPIALIQGYAEGLAECINDDAESRNFYCEVIMDEASKMNTMVQKLLTLNQLEFGNDKIVMERFDLAMLLKNKIQSIAILAQQKEAQISYSGKDSVYAWGDEFKIEEVITNYLSNALNHVSGAKKIEVCVEQDTEQVRVSVFNTGEQIPEADIGQIWDKFYKVDKARTREYGGSGVGLSIVKAIMESLNQKYGVENRPDGVEFWFTLKNGSVQKEDGEDSSDAAKEEKNEICDGTWRKIEPNEVQENRSRQKVSEEAAMKSGKTEDSEEAAVNPGGSQSSEETVSEGRSTEDQGSE